MRFKFSFEKNATLLAERGIGFEEIIQAIADGNVLDERDHYNQTKYPNQKILYVRLLQDVYVVPFIEEKNGDIFLKTIFPSRKAKKSYLTQLIIE